MKTARQRELTSRKNLCANVCTSSFGQVAEWLMATDSKSVGRQVLATVPVRPVGSNPTLSAYCSPVG